MVVKPVPFVEAMQAYSAPLEGRRGLLRLDFNENTVGPSPPVVEAIRAIPTEHYAIYPEYAELEARYGDVTGLPAEHVGLFNGVDAAIHAVFQAFGRAGDTFLTTRPTFGYYAPCADQQGMITRTVPYQLPDFAYPEQAIAEALADAPRILIICNPNNPTGTRLAPERIRMLAAAAPDTLVVVDELYEAFTGDSVLPEGLQQPNLLVLRSLSKTAGLAGLRIGFAVGSPQVVQWLRKVVGPYDVNGFAVAAALAVLGDLPYVDAYVRQVLTARDWLVAKLRAAGLRHHCAGGNFLLLWPRQDPETLAAALRRHAVLVRPMSGKPLIEGSLRVSVGTLEQMELFWERYQSCEAELNG